MSEDALLDALTSDLTDYLKKLGFDVERGPERSVEAARRTSLQVDENRFKVVAAPPTRESRSVVYIVPDDGPDAIDSRADTHRYSEFLDRTVQADKLCRQILDDDAIRGDIETFVPQSIEVDGRAEALDAPQYVGQWLSGPHGGLLVVLAPAGYGKTLLTRVIASRLADAHLSDTHRPRAPFPFLIPFGDFRRVASFESMIVSALHRRGVPDVMGAAFAHLVQRRRSVLILDGFDELLEERPEEARKNLRELLETLGGDSRVMVTARSTFFRTSTDVADFLEHGISADDVTIVDLRPFDTSQRRSLVHKLSPDQRTINYVTPILEMEGMGEAMGSPLLLKETIEALRDPKIRSQLSAETKRSGLFQVLEASIYERERQRQGHKFPDRVQARFVERAGEEMLRANVRGFSRDLIDVLAEEAADDFGFEAPTEDFQQLSDHHFFAVDHAEREVRFNHQVFREYFQAKALLRRSGEDVPWVRAILHERPLPEEVSNFLAEVTDGETAFSVICSGVGRVTSSAGYLAGNLTSLAQAVSTRGALECLFATVEEAVPIELRIEAVELPGFDFRSRMFERLELIDCDLRDARLGDTHIRELIIENADLRGARFSAGSPEVLQVGYGDREFEPARIQESLRELGASGLEPDEQARSVAGDEWLSDVRALLASRLRRFLTSVEGSAYLWDKSIGEKNLLGGLGQVDRWFTAQRLIPEMVRHGLITKYRRSHVVVYSLTDTGKTDAREFLANDHATGSVASVLATIVSADA